MSTVAEFIEARERIETLAKQISIFTERKAGPESKQRLDEANRQLETLKTMVANDVQVVVVDRLTRQLTTIGAKVEALVAKKQPKKKQQPVAEKS